MKEMMVCNKIGVFLYLTWGEKWNFMHLEGKGRW